MSTLNVTNLPNQETRMATAWVNFNGTGTVAVNGNASYNVSSVSDLAVGHYQVNFLTAMDSVDYAAVATANPLGTSVNSSAGADTFLTTSYVVWIEFSNGSGIDRSEVSSIVFGGTV